MMNRMLLGVMSLIILVALYVAYRRFRATKEQFANSDIQKTKTFIDTINSILNNISQRKSSVVTDDVGEDDEEAKNNSA